jgi:sulfide:quinone oxidoreductase
MQIRKLTPQVSVSSQIQPDELADLAAAGFRAVINNRPDGEAEDQPDSAALAAAAARHGLAYRQIPIPPGQYDSATIDAMAQALGELPGPVLAFCRTGTRSTSLWALQAARYADVDGVLKIAEDAGYDLAGIALRMHAVRGMAG